MRPWCEHAPYTDGCEPSDFDNAEVSGQLHLLPWYAYSERDSGADSIDNDDSVDSGNTIDSDGSVDIVMAVLILTRAIERVLRKTVKGAVYT